MAHKLWRTYQSPTTSPDVGIAHHFVEYNPDDIGTPLQVSSIGNEVSVQSEGLYRNGNALNYRFSQNVRNTWYSPSFDFDTQMMFLVSRFDAQFGQRYETEQTNLPSYDESKLLYGR